MNTAPAQPAPSNSATHATPEAEGWQRAKSLPCQISVAVEVSGFGLRDLMQLKPGSIVSSQTSSSANLPVRVNGELMAWGDFEVRGSRVSVRLTELA